jgi:hypothetical protein
MKKYTLSTLLCIAFLPLLAQTPAQLTWETLRDVKYTKKFIVEEDMDAYIPTFGTKVKPMEGKQVYITGYIVPVDVFAGVYVISKYPFAACFFCGGAGPETVMALKFKKEKQKFKTDQWLCIKGKLHLNSTDIYDMMYIVQDAELYTP